MARNLSEVGGGREVIRRGFADGRLRLHEAVAPGSAQRSSNSPNRQYRQSNLRRHPRLTGLPSGGGWVGISNSLPRVPGRAVWQSSIIPHPHAGAANKEGGRRRCSAMFYTGKPAVARPSRPGTHRKVSARTRAPEATGRFAVGTVVGLSIGTEAEAEAEASSLFWIDSFFWYTSS